MFIEIIFVVMLVIFYIKIYSTIMTLVLVLGKKKKKVKYDDSKEEEEEVKHNFRY